MTKERTMDHDQVFEDAADEEYIADELPATRAVPRVWQGVSPNEFEEAMAVPRLNESAIRLMTAARREAVEAGRGAPAWAARRAERASEALLVALAHASIESLDRYDRASAGRRALGRHLETLQAAEVARQVQRDPIAYWATRRLHAHRMEELERAWEAALRMAAYPRDTVTGKIGRWMSTWCDDALDELRIDGEVAALPEAERQRLGAAMSWARVLSVEVLFEARVRLREDQS